MSETQDEQVAFWRALASALREGNTLVHAVQAATEAISGTRLYPVALAMLQEVEQGGAAFEAVVRRADHFPRSVAALVRAGGAGGVLDQVADGIADGFADGSLSAPGEEPAEPSPMVRFWLGVGRMVGAGVPIAECFDILRDEVGAEDLAQAAETIREVLLEGGSIAFVMRELRDVFPEEVCLAVDRAEETGRLDEWAVHIAAAVKQGDLSALAEAPVGAGKEGSGFDPNSLEDMADVAPPRRIVNLTILQALRDGASDVHFEPMEGGYRIRYRVDGVLHELEAPPAELAPAIINRIKVMAGMDTAEKRIPQDGRIQLRIGGGTDADARVKEYDIRVSTLPTVHGERIVMRILVPQRDILRLDELGLEADDMERTRRLCHLRHGLVIAGGPTGSGKTTLFYAIVNEVNTPDVSILTVEDPVEYDIPGVAQTQVDPQVGRTFARTVRGILRQDPDIILIGEIRDGEVANLSAQCAMTGHLVLTTLHAPTAPYTLKRLLDIGVAPFVVNAAVAGVISQRLVRVLCPDCRQPVEPPVHSLPPGASEFLATLNEKTFFAPKGCERCHGTGYRGRTCIHEILVPGDRVKEAVAADADLGTLRAAARAEGMRTLQECGLVKAAQGITSIQEVLRVTAGD